MSWDHSDIFARCIDLSSGECHRDVTATFLLLIPQRDGKGATTGIIKVTSSVVSRSWYDVILPRLHAIGGVLSS